MTIRWALQPDVPDELPPDAVAVLLQMQNATTIHDAHALAVDAVKAGATSEQVSAAINQWMSLQAAQVQQVFAQPRFRKCWCGRPVLSGSLDGINCANHDADVQGAMERHPAGKGLDPDKPFPSRFDDRFIDSAEPKNRSVQ